ncbi:MAG: hypothetical protein ACP5N3_01710 [Candidatus Nanoarchaeia archaeon]
MKNTDTEKKTNINSNYILLPSTGITLQPEANTSIIYHGEVKYVYPFVRQLINSKNGKLTLYQKYVLIFNDLTHTTGGYTIGLTFESGKQEIHYMVSKQRTLQDQLFVSGHEEGHVLLRSNNLSKLENLLSSNNVNLNLNELLDYEEIIADLAGLCVLNRANINFFSLSEGYLERGHLKAAIKLYESHKIKRNELK